jgi:hypothetical protein
LKNQYEPLNQKTMKNHVNQLSALVVAIMLLGASSNGSEVDDILKELNGGSKKTSDLENAQSSQSAPSVQSPVSSESPTPSSASCTPKPKKKTIVKQAPPRQQVVQRPSIPVWNPRDKLPKEVTGQGVAGNFVIQGSSSEGTLILIPAEDADNPFARQFWVVNRTYGGGVPNVLVPLGQRQLVFDARRCWWLSRTQDQSYRSQSRGCGLPR